MIEILQVASINSRFAKLRQLVGYSVAWCSNSRTNPVTFNENSLKPKLIPKI